MSLERDQQNCGTRLGAWSEEVGFMDSEQFGLHPRRNTRDEILLARMLLEDAAKGDAVHLAAVVLILVDNKRRLTQACL